MLERTSFATAAAVRGALERALAAVFEDAIAVPEAVLTLRLTAALVALRGGVRALHAKPTLLLTAATVVHGVSQLHLAATLVLIAVSKARLAL